MRFFIFLEWNLDFHLFSHSSETSCADLFLSEGFLDWIVNLFNYKVRKESSLGFTVRVTDVVASCWAFSALFTSSCHSLY